MLFLHFNRVMTRVNCNKKKLKIKMKEHSSQILKEKKYKQMNKKRNKYKKLSSFS